MLKQIKTPDVTPGSGLVLVFAHRGYWEFCPENSLEAFQAAWDSGAEGIEMDVRLSASGADSVTPAHGGEAYSFGEAFVSHDYDLRGQAPDPNANASTPAEENEIYNLEPMTLRSRRLIDRHAKPILDSTNQPLLFHSFTELLTSYVQRAKTNTNAIDHSQRFVKADGITAFDHVARGLMLTIDIKNVKDSTRTITKNNSLYWSLVEVVKEFNDFQIANSIDLEDVVVFKLGFGALASCPTPMGDRIVIPNAARLTGLLSSPFVDADQLPTMAGAAKPYPLVTFIVYSNDLCNTSTAMTCSGNEPSAQTDSLLDFKENYPGFTINDWQNKNFGDNVGVYQNSGTWVNVGRGNFLTSENLAEGTRLNTAICFNNKRDGGTEYTSFCYSAPIQAWATSSLDFQIPLGTADKTNSVHTTLLTTDVYQQAINYLTAIGMNHTDSIK